MHTPLSQIGHIQPAHKSEIDLYTANNGRTKETLYSFIDMEENTKYLIFTAPAKDAADFEQRYYNHIVNN